MKIVTLPCYEVENKQFHLIIPVSDGMFLNNGMICLESHFISPCIKRAVCLPFYELCQQKSLLVIFLLSQVVFFGDLLPINANTSFAHFFYDSSHFEAHFITAAGVNLPINFQGFRTER